MEWKCDFCGMRFDAPTFSFRCPFCGSELIDIVIEEEDDNDD